MKKTISIYKGSAGEIYMAKGLWAELGTSHYNKVASSIKERDLQLHLFDSNDRVIHGSTDLRRPRDNKRGCSFSNRLIVDEVRALVFKGVAQQEGTLTLHIKRRELSTDRKSITLFFGIGETMFTEKLNQGDAQGTECEDDLDIIVADSDDAYYVKACENFLEKIKDGARPEEIGEIMNKLEEWTPYKSAYIIAKALECYVREMKCDYQFKN